VVISTGILGARKERVVRFVHVCGPHATNGRNETSTNQHKERVN